MTMIGCYVIVIVTLLCLQCEIGRHLLTHLNMTGNVKSHISNEVESEMLLLYVQYRIKLTLPLSYSIFEELFSKAR